MSRSAVFLDQLAQLSIQIDSGFDSGFILDLARGHALTVYDAAYLALAIRERLSLATLDKALQAAAAAEGIPLLS